jgi:hypothetical protein
MYTTLVSLAIIAAAAVQGVVAKDLKVNVPVLKQASFSLILINLKEPKLTCVTVRLCSNHMGPVPGPL